MDIWKFYDITHREHVLLWKVNVQIAVGMRRIRNVPVASEHGDGAAVDACPPTRVGAHRFQLGAKYKNTPGPSVI